MATEKPHVEIIFSSGAVVSFEAEKLTTKHRPLTGELTEIAWEGAESAPQFLRMESIDSVRFVRQ